MNNLRVGVLVDGPLVSAWESRMLRTIAAERGMEIALVVKCAYRRGAEKKAAAPATPWLLSLWMGLDKRLVKVRNDAFKKESLSSALPDVPTLSVEVESKECGDHFDARDLSTIAAYGINV